MSKITRITHVPTQHIAAAFVFALLAVVAFIALALPANAATKSDSGSVSALNVRCGGRKGPNLQNQRVNDAAIHGAANQENGSSASCAELGVLQPTDDAIYFCFTNGVGGTWTYVRNLRTNKEGWVLDRLLRNNGSGRFCGF